MSGSDDAELQVDVDKSLLEGIVKPAVELAPDQNAKFRWGEDELTLRTVDGSNVMMVNQSISESAFEEYSVDSEGDEFILGLPCDRLGELISNADPGETISLSYGDSDGRLNIQFSDVDYDLSGVDADSITEPDPTDLDHSTSAQIHSRVFDKTINVLGMAGSEVTFTIGDGEAKAFATGDTDRANLDLKATDSAGEDKQSTFDVMFEVDGGKVGAKYAVEFLEEIPQFVSEDYVLAKIDDKYPMLIETKRVDGEIDTEIVIAPRTN